MKVKEVTSVVRKIRKEFDDTNRKEIEKNYKAKKLFIYGTSPDKYNKISACETTKDILEDLQTAHGGTTKVKESKVDMLTTQYKSFNIKKDETIQEIPTRFTAITNELHCLGEVVKPTK